MNVIRLFPLLLLFVFACQPKQISDPSYIAFTGATLIDGTGAEPIHDGVLLIHHQYIVVAGPKEKVTIPAGATIVDVTGKTIIPGLINAHGHVGEVKGIEGGHYSAETIKENLLMYARYGITTVISLGGDKEEATSFRAVNDTINNSRARLYIAGSIINGKTPEEAVMVVDGNHRMGVDFMKIRVDDYLGTSPKMPEAIYKAVINRSHQLGYKVASHMYYLEDARKLVDAGADMLAHSVRDLPVDDAFIQLVKTKQLPYCPTLTRELSTFVYGDTAEFFNDPFFLKGYDSAMIRPLKDPARQKQISESKSAITYKQQLPTAMRNLKILQDAGVPIIFGTDSGVPTRFIGYFEHLEMSMMAEAGLNSMQILVSATSNVAQYLGLKKVGSLKEGNYADFVVLDADPLVDIKNTRKISSVYIGGAEMKR